MDLPAALTIFPSVIQHKELVPRYLNFKPPSIHTYIYALTKTNFLIRSDFSFFFFFFVFVLIWHAQSTKNSLGLKAMKHVLATPIIKTQNSNDGKKSSF